MSDSEDELSTFRYGTPLEPYDEDEGPVKKKPNQYQDQYAVDAHGRRRFHGAFTGGFSAGFGNSVATPEGFTPASFKSSRLDKASASNQRPDDFMDEEDRSEFGIAPRNVHTRDEFTGVKRPRQKQYHDGPIPGEPVLEQAIRAVHETAAVKILKSMGWKPGQGVGERLNKKDKKNVANAHKVYSCYIPEEFRQKPTLQTDEENLSSDSECDVDTLFAPDDYEPYMFRNKTDRFGLGYSGLSRHSVLGSLSGESTSHLVMSDKGKRVSIRGQAFGVGALEDDDDDIYAKEDMSNYDFVIGGAPVERQKKNDSKQSSGVLEGFVKSSKPAQTIPQYPGPALPRDYRPAVRRSRFEPTSLPARNQGLGRHELSPTARGALLGEQPLPKIREESKPTTSTNKENTQSTSREDVIAKITGRNVNFISSTSMESSNAEREKSTPDFIPISKTNNDASFVKELEYNPLSKDASFKPFASDKPKQERYEKFLKDKQAFLIERDRKTDKLSDWERNRELIEFEQAAILYKPLTGVMSDRFTHASQPDDQPTNPLCAVARSTDNSGLATQQQIDAASKGLYGALTRSKQEWRPEALVCKRFNVPEPFGIRPDKKKEDKPKLSYSIFEYLDAPVHDKESFTKQQTQFSGSKSTAEGLTNQVQEIKNVTENKQSIPPTSERKRMTVAELFLKESEEATKTNAEVTETIEKFDRMELYKSIFLSDSEGEEEPKTSNEKKFTDFTELIDTPKNIERNTSPSRGIFANINFDEINSWNKNPQTTDPATDKKDASNKNTNENTAKNKNMEVAEEINEAELYGPKIPNNLNKNTETIDISSFKPSFVSRSERNKDIVEIESSSSADSWVEAKDLKKLKKKKSKKHKNKKKGKHKKKDR